jgi:broad specificity phosphatase PhoE
MEQEGNRWGDSTFNDDISLVDARLSETGIVQAKDLGTKLLLLLQHHQDQEYSCDDDDDDDDDDELSLLLSQVELVVVSPLTRTLQTMDLGVRSLLVPTVPIVAHPDMRERVYTSSDTGRSVSILKEEFPYVDFSLVQPSDLWWYHHHHRHDVDNVEEWRPHGNGQTYAVPGEPREVFQDRLDNFQRWLTHRPEQTIILVTHWAILRAWTGDEFQNCESRWIEWNPT